MAAKKADTQRINLYITTEAVELLSHMTSENKRGRLVSELIKREAVVRGLIEGEAEAEPEGNGEIAELRRRLADMYAELDALAQQRGKQGAAAEHTPTD